MYEWGKSVFKSCTTSDLKGLVIDHLYYNPVSVARSCSCIQRLCLIQHDEHTAPSRRVWPQENWPQSRNRKPQTLGALSIFINQIIILIVKLKKFTLEPFGSNVTTCDIDWIRYIAQRSYHMLKSRDRYMPYEGCFPGKSHLQCQSSYHFGLCTYMGHRIICTTLRTGYIWVVSSQPIITIHLSEWELSVQASAFLLWENVHTWFMRISQLIMNNETCRGQLGLQPKGVEGI